MSLERWNRAVGGDKRPFCFQLHKTSPCTAPKSQSQDEGVTHTLHESKRKDERQGRFPKLLAACDVNRCQLMNEDYISCVRNAGAAESFPKHSQRWQSIRWYRWSEQMTPFQAFGALRDRALSCAPTVSFPERQSDLLGFARVDLSILIHGLPTKVELLKFCTSKLRAPWCVA